MIFVSRPELPITHLHLYFPTLPFGQGAALNSNTHALRTLAHRQILRGTQRLTRAEFLGAVADHGTEITLTQSALARGIGAAVLSRELKGLLTLITESLTSPRLCPQELAQSQRAYVAELRAYYESDRLLAWLWLMRRLYREHPRWGATAVTEAQINAVTLTEIGECWPQLFQASHLLPCVTTDLDRDVIEGWMNQVRGQLASSEALVSSLVPSLLPPIIPPLLSMKQRTLTWVHKPGRQQAVIGIALKAPPPLHDDFNALMIAVCALGGTFSSPLMQEVRVKRGLSYGAQADLRGEGEARFITLNATPEVENTYETVQVMLEVLHRGALGELTADEIKLAQNYLMNAHPFSIETPAMRASAMVRARLQGLPTEQLIDLPQILSLITPEEVKSAARQHLKMNMLECVILTDVDSHPELSKVTSLFDQVIKVQANDTPERVLELSS